MDLKASMTFEEARQWASFFLDQHNFHEDTALNYILWLMDWSLTDFVNHRNQMIEQTNADYLFDAFQRIIKFEPIQYIVGYTEFLGNRYKVTPSTLIPREETSGIIDIVSRFRHSNQSLRIIDIGTGTGILAITLKLHRPQSEVFAIDISKEALEVAQQNAINLNAELQFFQSDVFDHVDPELSFDIIVSNPPYISQDEVDYMDQSVLLYEPRGALFSNNMGLEIIEKILVQSQQYLAYNGLLVIEFGFKQADKVREKALFYFPHSDIEIIKDYNGINRFVCIRNKEFMNED